MRQFRCVYRSPWSARPLALLGAVVALMLTTGIFVAAPSGRSTARFFPSLVEVASAQEKEPASKAIQVQVPLPITGTVDMQVRSRLERALKLVDDQGARPVFILEFTGTDSDGAGSDFGRALSLANFLSGESMARARTVAYLHQSVKGHAVLPVLACEQIIMQKDVELGAATSGEPIDPTVREGYREIASRRRVVPDVVALGMLDPALTVLKITTPTGVTFTTADELPEMREKGLVLKEETLFQPGDPHLLTGAQMRQLGFASHLVSDRKELAAALNLAPRAIEQALVPEDGWKPVRIDLDGLVHQQQVNWIIRGIEDRRQRDDFNLLCLYINSPGGNPVESVRLARFLAGLGPEIHSVALIGKKALADSAIIALACDTIVIQADATLGGPGEANFRPDQFASLREPLQQAMQQKGRDWSLPLALVDPNVEVYAYTRPGASQARYLSADELASLDDSDSWSRSERPLDTRQGITGLQVEELGLGRAVQSLDEFQSLYQFDGPLQPIRSNWALTLVEWLADPRIAGVLLFIAWFALMFEMSTPGIGLPGFVSAVCFLLYFWSQFLHGTAGWLEILLFVGGIAFVAVEIFAVPGTGIFGIGGGLMIISSIILASQTFVLPSNAYQMKQFPVSLLVLAAGMAGGIMAVVFIRRFLPDTPYFNRMMLKPPEGEEREELLRRESLVSWGHLAGKTGITLTPLVPAGKAQFGDDIVDVVSDGELIDRGATIYVAEVLGNRVVVKPAPGR